MKAFLSRLWCRIWRFHDWTSAVQQDKFHMVFDKAKAQEDRVAHFHFTARMWCRRCGHFSELNEDKSTEPVKGCEPWTTP